MNYTKRPSFTEFSIEPSQQLKESLQAINVDVNDRAIRLLKEAMPASIERISGLLPEKAKLKMLALRLDDPSHAGKHALNHAHADRDVYCIIVAENEALKVEITTLIEACSLLKLWLELHIPRIEDGNNFGVSVQEDVLGELVKAEEAGLLAIEALTKFFIHRAKLSTKIAKYPQYADNYAYAIDSYDRKQLINMYVAWIDLRANYTIVYDIVAKNLERLVHPRNSNTSSMY